MGMWLPNSHSNVRSWCFSFFRLAPCQLQKDRQASNAWSITESAATRENPQIFLAYLKQLIEIFRENLGNQHSMSLCPSPVIWLKSPSVRFIVAWAYSFSIGPILPQVLSQMYHPFLKALHSAFGGDSIRKHNANRGQCITITQSLLILASQNSSPCRSWFFF